MVGSSFQGTGWRHPVAVDDSGRIRKVDGGEAIDRSIALILGTAKGQRLMRPDFGSDLPDFVFKPLSEGNRTRMATAVKKAINTWEPRVRVLAVEVTISPRERAQALISIDYEIRSANTKRNLVYPFYVQEGG